MLFINIHKYSKYDYAIKLWDILFIKTLYIYTINRIGINLWSPTS